MGHAQRDLKFKMSSNIVLFIRRKLPIFVLLGLLCVIVPLFYAISNLSEQEQQSINETASFLKTKCIKDLDDDIVPVVALDSQAFRRMSDVFPAARILSKYDDGRVVLSGYVAGLSKGIVKIYNGKDVRIVSCPPSIQPLS